MPAKVGSRIGLQSLLKALNRIALRLLMRPFLGPPLPLALQRRWLRLLSAGLPPPAGTERQELTLHAVPAVRVRCRPGGGEPAEAAAGRDAIVFAHGGAFMLGDSRSYAGFAGRIARASGADVYLVDYRRAPEHPHPAPSDDLFAAYEGVLALGHEPARTALLGDSAGGALVVSTALALAEMAVPAPAALVLISPWLDLTLSGASIALNAKRDAVLRRGLLEAGGRAYAGPLRRPDPRVSPLFADLAGLPPTLLQVGSDELLLDDSARFADRAWAAGVEVELQRFDGWWHDFQGSAPYLRGSQEALADVAAFLRRRLASDGGHGTAPIERP